MPDVGQYVAAAIQTTEMTSVVYMLQGRWMSTDTDTLPQSQVEHTTKFQPKNWLNLVLY
jgi:hypothetical protein